MRFSIFEILRCEIDGPDAIFFFQARSSNLLHQPPRDEAPITREYPYPAPSSPIGLFPVNNSRPRGR